MIAASSPRVFVTLLLAASAAIVGGALLSQYVGGLQPCELCLYQRWPYYAVIVATAVALLSGGDRAMQAVIVLCALLFAASTALAFYHVGVEQHWFAGPSACTGSITGANSVEALKALLLARQPVSCDTPSWLLFGVSLAGWNLVASILLTVACAGAAFRRRRQ
ncbi:MAG TPA: disulfide bond formation protein B [Stellaceae bacterium]|nr:disulfide bond formation protein B [Stellaceae bacterium]